MPTRRTVAKTPAFAVPFLSASGAWAAAGQAPGRAARRSQTSEYAVARNLGKTRFEPTRVLGPDVLKLAGMVVAAKAG